MSHAYEPSELWRCWRCGAGGELSIPPASYGEDVSALAARAHAVLNPDCAEEWGADFVRLSQGEYPD